MHTPESPPPWEEFTTVLLSHYTPGRRAKATRAMMAQALREMGAHCPTIAHLSTEAVGAFVDSQPAARSISRTVALLRCLRRAANFARRKRWIESSPFAWQGVTSWIRPDAKPAPPRKLVLTSAEMGRFLRVLDARAGSGDWRYGRLQALGYLYAYTAFRAREATHLLRRNYDRAARTLAIEPLPNWRPKTVRTSRSVPVHPRLHEVLDVWERRCGDSEYLIPGARGGPWTGGPGYTPLDGFREIAAEAGINRVTIIAIRRTLATLSPSWGIDPEFRRQLLGHTAVETSQDWYVQREVELLRGAVDRIHYGPDQPAAPPPPEPARLRIYRG